jgi:outer membrane protein assembly factor BamB
MAAKDSGCYPLGMPGPLSASALFAAVLLTALVTVSARADAPSGWRNDGTGVAQDARPPIPGAQGTGIRWKVKTASWSNSSPVRLGDQICITEEPTTLACYDMDSGERRWAASNLYTDTLEDEARGEMEALFAQLDQDAERLEELRIELSRVQRELRQAAPDSGIQQRAETLLLQLDTLRTRIEAHAVFGTTDDKGVMGYSTPTPAVADGFVYALFGNGVLSKFSPSGERAWSVWLGKQAEPMDGYHTGTAASPVMADGVLVVPYGRISGVDPATGRVLWGGAEYTHFGTPAVAVVGGRALVVTPAGQLLDARTGSSLGTPLGSLRYVGPVVRDDTVFVIGVHVVGDEEQGTRGLAYRLSEGADGRIEATELWRQQLSDERIYATPLVSSDRIWILTTDGELQVLDTRSGERLGRAQTSLEAVTGAPSPTLGGQILILGSERGPVQAWTRDDDPDKIGEASLEPQLSTPLLVGERIFVRGLDHLWCLEGAQP